MKNQNSYYQNQLKSQKLRWNKRADTWDKEINQKNFYVNFENGYEEFLKFENKILKLNKNLKVGIDIGCGSGVTSEVLSCYVDKIYLLDISNKMLKVAKQKVPKAITLCASATEIPLNASSVDVAISRGVVVSHLPREVYLNFFRELERIVKKSGIVIFDFMSNLSSAHFSIQSPKIAFTKEEIEIILTGHSFTNIQFHGDDSNRVIRVAALKK